MSLKIVFMGTPEFSVPTLKTLINNKFEILSIYTQPPKKSKRGQKINVSSVQKFSEKNNLPVRNPENLNNNGIYKKKSELHKALNNSRAILELKEQKKNFSREVLYFEDLVEQLGFKQKKQLKEFSNAIKDRQIRVVISTSITKKSSDYKKYKKIFG